MSAANYLELLDGLLNKRAAPNIRQVDTGGTGYLGTDDEHTGIGLDNVLKSTSKLLAINRGHAMPDDRNALRFQRAVTPDKLMAERLTLDVTKNRRSLVRLAARHKSLAGVPPFIFDKDVESAFVSNPLASPLEEINPLALVTQNRRITRMGPGGIGSDEAVTPDMQDIHASQFGFICPISGPESSRAGVDARLSTGVRIGDDGKLYQKFLNRRLNRYEWKSPEDLADAVVAFPE